MDAVVLLHSDTAIDDGNESTGARALRASASRSRQSGNIPDVSFACREENVTASEKLGV
jgi:hypothetical protein